VPKSIPPQVNTEEKIRNCFLIHYAFKHRERGPKKKGMIALEYWGREVHVEKDTGEKNQCSKSGALHRMVSATTAFPKEKEK